MRLASSDGPTRRSPAATTRCARPPRALRAGRILAIKGIGGFHLACRADDERAVATLRARKHREDKPFALMVASRRRRPTSLCASASSSATLLLGPERPIVLAPRRAGARGRGVGRPGRARARA